MKRNAPPVLVVDDDEIIRQHLSKVLALRGIACDCAVDGEDALHKIACHHYDLVIADLRMPELDGHSLALVLLHQLHPPRIIALTGMKDPSLVADLLAHGVEEIVYKPVDYFDLADRLKLMFYTDQLNAKSNNGVGENRNVSMPSDMPSAQSQISIRGATPMPSIGFQSEGDGT